MKRSNPYEAAFEAYLRWHRLCYIAVDETRRSYLGESLVKNLDFIVHGEAGARLLVDVKGRRFPSGSPGKQRRVWECWSMREDVDGLARWAELFGEGFQGLLVFAYHILPTVVLPDDTDDLWTWRGRRYLLRAVPIDAYREHLRVRSPKWDTVDLPGPVFRDLVRPFHLFSQAQPQVAGAEEIPW
ncbi:MAG TPA: HYExAFE family protein [Gemmataceae bacterium]|nr:HYExAFE family protein [Gemmataceae bacterium]